MQRSGWVWVFILLAGLGLFFPWGAIAASGPWKSAPDAQTAGEYSGSQEQDLPWKTLLPGFALAQLASLTDAEGWGSPFAAAKDGGQAALVILRFDPERYAFSLYMASEEGPASLEEVAQRHGLLAAVNAGMYLPDQVTSTGHMRSNGHVNNPRVAEKFGAFLVANPSRPLLPPAALLDRDKDDWRSALEAYTLVVQNYRLTDSEGRILWPENSPAHSIAALGQDSLGRFLFIMHRDPLPPSRFAARILAMPLGVKFLMYLEGGTPAMLLVRAGAFRGQWSGIRLGGLIGGEDAAKKQVPNVLGVKVRE